MQNLEPLARIRAQMQCWTRYYYLMSASEPRSRTLKSCQCMLTMHAWKGLEATSALCFGRVSDSRVKEIPIRPECNFRCKVRVLSTRPNPDETLRHITRTTEGVV